MFTMEDIAQRASDTRELLRAREIVVGQRLRLVRERNRSGDVTRAEIRGSGDAVYRVVVDQRLDGTFTCPLFRRTTSRFCKHIAAVAMIWIDASVEAHSLDPDVAMAVGALDEQAVRALLIEAAGRARWVRDRILTGQWPP